MSGIPVKGSGKATRSGAQTLALLASPLNCEILAALAEGPMRQSDLRRRAGLPAQTTLRAQLRRLARIDAIEKHRRDRFPGELEHRLTDAGRELLAVTSATERWLERAPDGALALGSSGAKAAINALVEGWSTTMLRPLASKPMTLTELDGVIALINYPSLERRLGAMRLAGLVVARPGQGRGTPYALTEWGRQGIGPLVAAARWERRNLRDEAPPIGKLDIETAFLLAMPLLQLPEDFSGSCRMAAEVSNGARSRLVGVLVEGGEGRISSCTTRLAGYPDAWASGSIAAWLTAVIEPDPDLLELGGNCELARGLVDGLHESLFAGSTSWRTL